MSRFTKDGKVKPDALPSTLQRSDEKAQETFAATLDAAEEQYGDGERARRTAFASLKHGFEKVGDHWEPKEKKGPPDEQAARGSAEARPTAGGVDANASKQHLYDLAKKLDIKGRSGMSKDELVDALQKANERETRRAREQ
ncbi:cation transport regulator ChaB [Arthrobacter sp. NamB2]|uniref:ChaB family protein n=1 Tax=Arthrobacter sp. NamB2 TaxID=2576035 RepID=UPI0010C9A965|nr:ChaB family protein [Arthrobacter sp. NamB2]TKV29249.1 cation transport regulator ChaB [Arthrobacter sp. NamB2]